MKKNSELSDRIQELKIEANVSLDIKSKLEGIQRYVKSTNSIFREKNLRN